MNVFVYLIKIEKYEEIDRKQTNMARKMLKMIEGFYTPFMPRSVSFKII